LEEIISFTWSVKEIKLSKATKASPTKQLAHTATTARVPLRYAQVVKRNKKRLTASPSATRSSVLARYPPLSFPPLPLLPPLSFIILINIYLIDRISFLSQTMMLRTLTKTTGMMIHFFSFDISYVSFYLWDYS
jgi:hypothetical protein